MAVIRKYFEVEGQLIVGNFSVDEIGNIVTSGGYNSDTFIFNEDKFLIDGETGNTTIAGTLSSAGQATLNSLVVTNNSTISGNLILSGDIAVNGGDLTTNKTTFNLLNNTATTINIGSAATQITLGKTGDNWVTTNSNLEVTRNLTVGYQFDIADGKFQFDGVYGDQGATRLQGILEVGQNALFESGLTVDGPTTLHTLTVNNNFAVSTKFSIDHTTGNTSITGTLDVTGNVETGELSSTNTTVTGTLDVTGAADFGNNLNVDGTLNVEGASTVNDTLHVTGAVDFDNNLNVDGTLNVLGSVTIDDNLDVDGTLSVVGTLDVDGAISSNASISTSGGSITGQSIHDTKGELRAVPQNEPSGSYTLVAADHGKHILASNTITIDGGIFTAGQNVVIINWTGGNITLSQGTNMTMYQVGTSNTGNRTLAQRGLVTLFFVNANNCIISGSGLS